MDIVRFTCGGVVASGFKLPTSCKIHVKSTLWTVDTPIIVYCFNNRRGGGIYRCILLSATIYDILYCLRQYFCGRYNISIDIIFVDVNILVILSIDRHCRTH